MIPITSVINLLHTIRAKRMGDPLGPGVDGILSELSDDDLEDLIYGTEMTPDEREEFIEGLTRLTFDDPTY